MSPNNNSVKSAVLLDANDLVQMIEVSSLVLVCRIITRPIPSFSDLRPGELVLWHLRVNACTRVAVPAPGFADIVPNFEDNGFEATVS